MGRRLTLAPQVRYAPTADGAAVLGPSSAVALRGATVHAWLERLRPLLDGRQDVDAALAPLPDGHRTVALRLLDTLRAHGFVREAADPLPHGLTDDELRVHAPEIAYVGNWLDSPEHHFERYRAARVLAAGDGPLADAARHALLACGLRRVHAADPREAAGRVDAVVYAGDGEGPDGVRAVAAIEDACRATGTPLFRALARYDGCWLLPYDGAQRWADVLHRLRHRPAPAQAPEPTPAATALVGGRVALAVFRLLTGIPEEDDTGVLRIDWQTLASHRHRVLAAPPAGAADKDFAVRLKELREAPALAPDDLTRRLSACADGLTGPYGPPTTAYGTQIPLTVARCDLPGGGTVTGAALDPRAAHDEALRRAAAAHALAAAVERTATDHLLAERLADGRTEPLPASVVLPLDERAPAAHATPAPAGTACAESWDAAVEAALFGAVRQLALRRMAAPDAGPYPVLDPAVLPHHSEAARHWRLVGALGPLPPVLDVSGDLGAPVVALVAEDGVAVGCAAPAAEAFAEAARALLARRQGACPPAGTTPAVRTGAPAPVPAALPGLDPAGRCRLLADRLAARGWTAYAVPLDHDSAFAAHAPFVARVVLLGAH
ncbi:group-specific protein [Streptomyces mobaraensis]|uniref:Group-specific protein n=1 Tax=Streptomyces mobaraensis TaxID=35621 RepID=A0A5N5W105_STRMB|nr:group-specific protein [Streptomyces mobaraensis]KAB7834278.1 group-specific protein [Streptomyces mobaraensis]